MVELLIVLGLGAVVAVRVAVIRRAALRRARLRAEAVLDELAAAACDHLAGGAEPSTSRRCARAVDRYERTRDRVATARTRRELDALVARHDMRRGAIDLVVRGRERVRAALRPRGGDPPVDRPRGAPRAIGDRLTCRCGSLDHDGWTRASR